MKSAIIVQCHNIGIDCETFSMVVDIGYIYIYADRDDKSIGSHNGIKDSHSVYDSSIQNCFCPMIYFL